MVWFTYLFYDLLQNQEDVPSLFALFISSLDEQICSLLQNGKFKSVYLFLKAFIFVGDLHFIFYFLTFKPVEKSRRKSIGDKSSNLQ